MKLIEKRKKRKAWPYSSKTHTTGNPALNIAFFNKCMGTDLIPNEPADGTDTSIDSGETSGEGGDLGEALVETKREVRRYYVRPQNIFCSNKAEVIRALIDVGNNNCTIYTLKNLEDNDDIHKLTNRDIIYYYDDGILYDKNKVRVMDYDLYIKHEEERKHFTGDPEEVSDTEFNKEYEDRITDRSLEENWYDDMYKKRNKAELIQDIEKATSFDPVYLGYNMQDGDVIAIDDDPYGDTEFYAYKEDDKYVVFTNLVSHHGVEREGDEFKFDTVEALLDWVAQRELVEYVLVEDKSVAEGAFDLDFIGINAFNEAVLPKYTCCICGENFEGYGNNPYPYKDEGTCCDACNRKFVIPARLEQYQLEYNLDEN